MVESLENTTFMPLAGELTYMRFLVDECTGPAVAEWLRTQNHGSPPFPSLRSAAVDAER